MLGLTLYNPRYRGLLEKQGRKKDVGKQTGNEKPKGVLFRRFFTGDFQFFHLSSLFISTQRNTKFTRLIPIKDSLHLSPNLKMANYKKRTKFQYTFLKQGTEIKYIFSVL